MLAAVTVAGGSAVVGMSQAEAVSQTSDYIYFENMDPSGKPVGNAKYELKIENELSNIDIEAKRNTRYLITDNLTSDNPEFNKDDEYTGRTAEQRLSDLDPRPGHVLVYRPEPLKDEHGNISKEPMLFELEEASDDEKTGYGSCVPDGYYGGEIEFTTGVNPYQTEFDETVGKYRHTLKDTAWVSIDKVDDSSLLFETEVRDKRFDYGSSIEPQKLPNFSDSQDEQYIQHLPKEIMGSTENWRDEIPDLETGIVFTLGTVYNCRNGENDDLSGESASSTLVKSTNNAQPAPGTTIAKSTTPHATGRKRPLYQDLCADIEDYTGHAYVPSDWHYINPTDGELASLKEVDWSAPGDYSYMVDWMDPQFRPKLFQATSSGYFYIESTANRRDPDQKENHYYRRFVPEDYLPKEYLDIPLENERGENWHNGSSDIGWYRFWENAPKLKEDVELPEADPWRTVPEKFDFYSKYPDLYVVRRVGKSCLPDIRVKPATIENLFSLSEPGNGARDIIGGNVLIYGPAGASFIKSGWAKTNSQSELLAGSEWVLRNTTTGEEFRIVDSTESLPPKPWPDVPRSKQTDEQKQDIKAWEMLDVDPTPGVIVLNSSFDDGEYELSEVIAPNGYMLLTRPIKFTVDNFNVDTWFSTLGEIVNIKPGMLHWRKVDEQGNPLSGSVWKIVNTDSGEEYTVEDDSSGNIFKEDLVSEIGNDVLAQPGNIDVPLPPGKYTVQEIQAPEGYILDSTVHTAVLDASTGTAEGVYEDYLGELVNKRIPTVTVTTTETPDPTTVTEVPPTVTTTLTPETVTTTTTPPAETVSTTQTIVSTPPTSTVTLPPETRVVTTTKTPERETLTTTETTESTVTTTQTPPAVTTTETTENTVTTTQTPPAVTTTETTENTVTTTQTPPPVTTTETTENTVTTTQTPPAVTTTETTENTVTTTQTPPTITTTETVTEPAVTITETNDCDCTPVTVTETPEPVTETVTQPVPSTTVENGVEIVQLPPTTVTETETASAPADSHTSSDTQDQPDRERSGLLANTGANTAGIVVFSGLMLMLGGIFVARRKK